jgi:hypothetical protein
MKKKNLLAIATAGAVVFGYAVVSTNAFADTSVATPVPAVSAPVAPVAPAITQPTVPSIPMPSGLSSTAGIQAPSGLANATLPSAGDDDGDDQSGDLSAGDSLGDDGDDNGDNSTSVGVSTSQSDDNGGDSLQDANGQDGSGSED